MPEPPGTLKGDDAVALYRDGKDKWNEWANQHPGWEVDFSDKGLSDTTRNHGKVLFDSYIFPGPVSFERADFGNHGASFNSACFKSGDVSFKQANFHTGGVSFDHSTFGDGNISFYGVQFRSGNVSFYETDFGNGDFEYSGIRLAEPVNFKNAKFGKGKVDFSHLTIMQGDLNFHSAEFDNSNVDLSNMKVESGDVIFTESRFHNGEVSFDSTKVKNGNLLFDEAKFKNVETSFDAIDVKEDIYFRSIEFIKGTVYFSDAICHGDFYLDDTKFIRSDLISFNGLHVHLSLMLDRSEFSSVPDLRNILIGRDVSMINMKVEYQKQTPFGSWASDPEDSDKYRKLKSLAIHANDHQREIEFFALEEKAKEVWHLTPAEYIPTFLYEFFSNFGRSIAKPLAWLGSIWFVTAILFRIFGIPLPEAPMLSAIHALPILPWSRATRDKLLCSLHEGECQESFNIGIEVVAYTESLLALPLIFLIGLALRNRFRL